MKEQQIIEQALAILENRLQQPGFYFIKSEDTKNYLRLNFSELGHESFRVMFLDAQHGLIELKELFRGTIKESAVYPREVVKAALHFNAAAVVLSHNHPSGITKPSEADKYITQQLIEALKLIDVSVLDHIIVGRGLPYSFAEHHLL